LGGGFDLQALFICLLIALDLLLQGTGTGLGLRQQSRWYKQEGHQRSQENSGGQNTRIVTNFVIDFKGADFHSCAVLSFERLKTFQSIERFY
jgi:hypothetical protein